MKLYICLFQVCAFVHKYQVHLFEIHFNGKERVEEVEEEVRREQEQSKGSANDLFCRSKPLQTYFNNLLLSIVSHPILVKYAICTEHVK